MITNANIYADIRYEKSYIATSKNNKAVGNCLNYIAIVCYVLTCMHTIRNPCYNTLTTFFQT